MNAILIGYGYWGKIIERYLQEEESINLKKIFRGREEKLKLKKFVENNEIEVAFICTPIETHYELCKFFIENRVNVFCEKPLCETLNQTIELFDLAKKQRCILFVDYIYRYSSSIKKLKEHIEVEKDISYINMKIQQLGKFYKYTDVTNIIGVHMISVIIYILDKCNNYSLDIIFEKRIETNVVYRLSKLKIDKINVFIEESVYSLNKVRTIEVIFDNKIYLFDMLSKQTLKSKKGYWDNQNFIQEKDNSYEYDEKNNLKSAIKNFSDILNKKNIYEFESQDILIAKILDEYRNIT